MLLAKVKCMYYIVMQTYLFINYSAACTSDRSDRVYPINFVVAVNTVSIMTNDILAVLLVSQCVF